MHFADRLVDYFFLICILQIDFGLRHIWFAFCRSIQLTMQFLICMLQIDLLTLQFWLEFCRSIQLTVRFPIDFCQADRLLFLTQMPLHHSAQTSPWNLKCGHLFIPCTCTSRFWLPKPDFNLRLLRSHMTFWVWFSRLKFINTDLRYHPKISEAGPLFKRDYFPKCSHLAIATKLH